MRARLAVVVLALVAWAAYQPLLGQIRPGSLPRFGAPEGWPQKHPVPELPPEPSSHALPQPSITEPFGIRAALHEPARVADAVVSVLALLGIGIAPGDATSDLTMGSRAIRLSEREVRALIAMGKADAEAQLEDPNGPATFSALHAALSPAPDVSVERLAEIFTEHYENADGVVGQLFMGEPFDADMPLLRTELWLLFADAIWRMDEGSQAARRGPRIVFARAQVLQGSGAFSGWSLSAIRSSRSGLTLAATVQQELDARMPLIAASSLTLTQGARGHKGHGGPGATVAVQAEMSLPTIRVQSGPVLVPSQGTLAGIPVRWTVDSAIQRHASATPLAGTVPPSGVARLSITPRAERAKGQGGTMTEMGIVTISADLGRLVDKAYGVTSSGLFGQSVSGQTTAAVEWHDPDMIEFMIRNAYNVGSNVAAVGLTREGSDMSHGTIARGEDGIYRGSSNLVATGQMNLPGGNCGVYSFAWQYADVIGIPIPVKSTTPPLKTTSAGPGGVQLAPGTPNVLSPDQQTPFYNAVHRTTDYTWISGTPTLYLRLEFYPRTAPRYSLKDDCQEEIPGPRSRPTPNFVPLNDAQWTIEGMYEGAGGSDQANRTGYAIAVPDSGEMVYEDRTSANQSIQVGSFDLGKLVKAESIWYVTVTRTAEK